jgi:2-C-methyl-D-erythritol 2,4-cyclodiphosphate synthase/2-C-methyl-D-erythritol 4-phosphate cytidylyltransferase
MEHVAILLAGGSGDRMGATTRDKILLQIGGKSVFAHVLDAFVQSETQDALVVVARDDTQRKELKAIVRKERIQIPVFYTLGGAQRQDSVRKGLELIPSEARFVTIHDCARPAVNSAALKAVRKTVVETSCAVSLAHRVTDTIRQFEGSPLEKPIPGKLLSRDGLWAMETPQAFPRSLIDEAHRALTIPVTDDLAAVELIGKPVLIVESIFQNPKLTRPADLLLLENILNQNAMNESTRPPYRVGYGYDIHRLEEGRPLILGGVALHSDVGLVGHSDADVLTHAIADAILGGCGLPDIGHYFPNTDASIKGISSQVILKKACKEAERLGYRLLNVDASLIAERPKISPYLERIKRQLSNTMDLPQSEIGIKATTQESIGALGKGAGIAAHAVAALARQ